MELLSSDHISVIVSFMKTIKDYYHFMSTCNFLYNHYKEKRNIKRFYKLQFSGKVISEVRGKFIYATFKIISPKIHFTYVDKISENDLLSLFNAIKTPDEWCLINDYYNTTEIKVEDNYVHFRMVGNFINESKVSLKCEDCIDAFQKSYNLLINKK